MKLRGLPHSEIPGYASTRLTEAYRSVATSFIGPRRQGIHPAPILVCTNVDQGFGPLPARMRAVNGMRTAVWRRRRSRGWPALPGEVRGKHNHDSHYADNEPKPVVRKNDVDKNLCGWEGAPSGSSPRRSDGSGEPPVGACLSRRRSRVPRKTMET